MLSVIKSLSYSEIWKIRFPVCGFSTYTYTVLFSKVSLGYIASLACTDGSHNNRRWSHPGPSRTIRWSHRGPTRTSKQVPDWYFFWKHFFGFGNQKNKNEIFFKKWMSEDNGGHTAVPPAGGTAYVTTDGYYDFPLYSSLCKNRIVSLKWCETDSCTN